MHQDYRLNNNVALIAPLLSRWWARYRYISCRGEMMFVLFAVLAAIAFFGLRAMLETATRMGEKLSVKELGRDYREVLKTCALSPARWPPVLSACRCWRG